MDDQKGESSELETRRAQGKYYPITPNTAPTKADTDHKYRYSYRSRNRHNKVETWGCLMSSCKARIAITPWGQVIWASGGHNHPASKSEPTQPVRLDVKLMKYVDTSGKIDGSAGEPGVIPSTGTKSTSEPKPGSSSAEQGDSTEGTTKEDTSYSIQVKTEPNLDNSFVNLEIQDAFSLADWTDTACTGAENEDDKSRVFKQSTNKSEDVEPSLTSNAKSFVIHDFRVTKDTETMRNILAQALERCKTVDLKQTMNTKTGPSRTTRRKRSTNSERTADVHTKLEEEWQWQWEFSDHDTAKGEEDDDEEINVDVSEPE